MWRKGNISLILPDSKPSLRKVSSGAEAARFPRTCLSHFSIHPGPLSACKEVLNCYFRKLRGFLLPITGFREASWCWQACATGHFLLCSPHSSVAPTWQPPTVFCLAVGLPCQSLGLPDLRVAMLCAACESRCRLLLGSSHNGSEAETGVLLQESFRL